MSTLKLFLLGPPRIEYDGAPLEIQRRKAMALLVYLAVTGESQRRDTLATLLWPDSSQSSARAALRRDLSILNKTLGGEWLVIERETVGLRRSPDLWFDAAQFQDLLAAVKAHDHSVDDVCPSCLDHLTEAIALYRDDFLTGFTLSDCPDFDDWQFFQAESLRQELASALERLVRAYSAQGQYEPAIPYARRWLTLDPLHEPAHRYLMHLYAYAGQQAAALRQYQLCVQTLADELGISPSEETISLYEQIRSTSANREESPFPPPLPQPDLPTQPTPLIEQETEGGQPSTSPGPAVQLGGERRLVTVIIADVKGSTALLEQIGAEAWLDLMNQVFQILSAEIYRLDGEVNQFQGDRLVAFFGAATAHEDDPERAVMAALAMQEAIKIYAAKLAEPNGADAGHPIDLRLRIGVNTGEVIVTSIGDSRRHSENTAMGEAIALANRLEAAAEPGTVLVGEHTYHLVAPLFEWEIPEEIMIKVMNQPVAVYRPLAHKALPDKPRGIAGLRSPLVGRAREFGALKKAINDLQAGVGGVVTLVGEAGLGKSRLVTELHQWAQSQTNGNLQWMEGRCLSYGTSVVYQLWLDMLRELVGVTPDDPPAAVHEALQERLKAICLDCIDDVYPYLGRMMSLPLSDEIQATLRGLGAEGLKVGTFRGMEMLTEYAVRQGEGLVIVCEDLHWADPTSLELLEHLLPLVDRTPLVFICVFRPETEHICWRIKETAARLYHHRHTDLWLEPLSSTESATLVSNLLHVEGLPPGLKQRILNHAEGNPFYVEEILRSLMDCGFIVREETADRWIATQDVDEIAIPDTLHGVLMARIDRLHEETKRVLQLASVVGRVFFYRVLAEIAKGERQLDAHLLVLQRGQLIRERARVPELEYIFKHHLTKEAAYNSLLKRERRVFHRQVAEALERLFSERVNEQVGLLAHHWERAEEPAKATEYLLRAGDQARLAYANEEAATYFNRALTLLDTSSLSESRQDWRLEALRGLGLVYFDTGQLADAETHFREAIALGQEMALAPRELVRLYYWLGEVLWWQNRYDDQIRIGQEGLALLDTDTESVEAALMNHIVAVGYEQTENQEKDWEFSYQTARFIRRLPYIEEFRAVYVHLWSLYTYYDKNIEEGLRWLRLLETQATAHHDLRALAEVHRHRGGNLKNQGDLHGSLLLLQQALDLFRRIGDAKHESACLFDMSWNALASGNLQKAEELVNQSLEITLTTGNQLVSGYIYQLRGTIAMCQKAWSQAMDAFQQAAQILETHHQLNRAWPTYLLGKVYLAQGNRKEALKQFLKSLDLAKSETFWFIPFGFAHLLSGLEAAYDDPDAYRAFCRQFQSEHPEISDLALKQWYLEPHEVRAIDHPPSLHDEFAAPLSSDWVWQDPLADCSFTVQNGLVIRAANGRDLQFINLSAPRMLRRVEGNFVIQTACAPIFMHAANEQQPSIGGLLLWKDKENFLRLDRGVGGQYEILFDGSLENKDIVIGRGYLPADFDNRIFLRLERAGNQVQAFCSVDEQHWFTVGNVAFPIEGPVQVGLLAIGNIYGQNYYGDYPEGTAIRFESFQLWDI